MPERPDSVGASNVLDLLTTGVVVSGEDIATELGCSRAVVGKHVKNLRRLGWSITSVPKRGHRLDDVKPWEPKLGDLMLGVYKDAPDAPPAQAAEPPTDPAPQPPAPATPTPPSQESPGAGTYSYVTPPPWREDHITVNWFVPRTGRARLSPVAILAAIDDLEAEERRATVHLSGRAVGRVRREGGRDVNGIGFFVLWCAVGFFVVACLAEWWARR